MCLIKKKKFGQVSSTKLFFFVDFIKFLKINENLCIIFLDFFIL